MRVIIAGGRNLHPEVSVIDQAVKDSGFEVTTVISGAATGIDSLGEFWASQHQIPWEEYPAMWEKFGKSAGPRRNELMAQNADALIAIWNGTSAGTAHMIQTAKRRGLPVFEVII